MCCKNIVTWEATLVFINHTVGSSYRATFQMIFCVLFMGKPTSLNYVKITLLCSLILEFPVGGKYRSVCLNRMQFEVDLMLESFKLILVYGQFSFISVQHFITTTFHKKLALNNCIAIVGFLFIISLRKQCRVLLFR